MTILWREDRPELRRSRPREAKDSGIYYGYDFRDFVNQPESRWIRLHRWYDGCTSDPMFWRLLVYGGLFSLIVVGAMFV